MSFFKKKTKALYTIANGKSIPIEEVPDDVFSSKMMGDGIAILPVDGKIFAPCDGEVSMLMEHSLHALGILNNDGIELLIHIGIDTVELMGEGFIAHVKKGDMVCKGDLLISFDQTLLAEKGYNTISMLILVEANTHEIITYHTNETMCCDESILLEYK